MSPRPPPTPLVELLARIEATGFAALDAHSLAEIACVEFGAFARWNPFWEDLPRDLYLKDGGRYRFRRHGSFVVAGDAVQLVPQRAHWQPVEYNALHGGIERWFEPLPAALVADPAWAKLLTGLARVASRMRRPQPWFVEAHPFRIDTGEGIGRPTPEGAHRDGVDLVAVILVGRHGILGGETRVFEADGPNGVRFTLDEPWSALLLDDARVVHESTPIRSLDAARPGHRDTLVVTLRANGFQGPGARR